tara:strand:- start:11958 stop:12500 length:543 start_codon:yes stop_codon:yes gene_type:complete
MKYMTGALAIVGLAGTTAAIAQTTAALSVKSDIVQAGGSKIGAVTLTNGPAGVLLRLTASGLTPGWHAMHFHATGDCSDQGFQKSGAHINHEGHKMPHGLLNAEGPDSGELPNIYVPADGTANAEAFSGLVSLDAASARPNLLDADGSALVIHAGPDDHVTQPIGGAGARVACAVIRPAG